MLLVGGLEESECFSAFLLSRNVHPALNIPTSVSIYTFHVPAQLTVILAGQCQT